MATTSKRKLVLHMDVNNTVLIGDTLTNQTSLEDVLNEYISGVIWGREDKDGKWRAIDYCLHAKSTDDDATSYYEFAQASFARAGQPRSAFKEHIRTFCDQEAGKPFRKYYVEMQEQLRFVCTPGNSSCDALVLRDSRGTAYHRIVPSFFRLLSNLIEEHRDFSIIFRTFGGDGSVVLEATKLFLGGAHPCFPTLCSGLKVDSKIGVIKRSSSSISLSIPDKVNSSSSREIYDYLTGTSGVQLIVDDFLWWKKSGFQHFAGKPLLLDTTDVDAHHIMFDDNIRMWDPQNSIVDVQFADHQAKHIFKTVEPDKWDNIFIVKADLHQSVCNDNYFMEKVRECEQNYSK